MIIRASHLSDTPAIVQLLKESLGESLLKKTTDIWQYKHEQNPFGPSYVLLAEEASHLIGVRAFMQWRWQKGSEVLQAYRAVDTATHPQHQGRGIFKKLTLQAVSEVQDLSECFIFNTPNEKSRPGYLKMGWEVLGKIRLSLVPTLFYSFLLLRKDPSKKQQAIDATAIDHLCSQHNKELEQQNVFFTPKSAAYLAWRYENNPMQSYFISTTTDYYVACYVKRHRYFKELRVAEVVGATTPESRNKLRHYLMTIAFQERCLLITTADKNLFPLRLYGTFGPQMTCRDLTKSQLLLQSSKKMDEWHYSLGDLELF